MTEAEWLACEDPTPMLEFLQGQVSERKLRLFAVACSRRIWKLLANEPRQWIEVAEQYADGLVTQKELNNAATVAKQAVGGRSANLAANADAFSATYAAVDSIDATSADAASILAANAVAHEQTRGAETVTGWDDAWKDERVIHSQLLHCIVANSFRPVTINAAWLSWNDSTVRRIAQAIYDERAFDRMPIMADALEDSGCSNADILNHCRQPGEHVRGCHVLDLLLGKQ